MFQQTGEGLKQRLRVLTFSVSLKTYFSSDTLSVWEWWSCCQIWITWNWKKENNFFSIGFWGQIHMTYIRCQWTVRPLWLKQRRLYIAFQYACMHACMAILNYCGTSVKLQQELISPSTSHSVCLQALMLLRGIARKSLPTRSDQLWTGQNRLITWQPIAARSCAER